MKTRLLHVVLALWAGGLWTICAFVAPTLFAALERQAAGQLVGRFFAAAAWAGLAFGVAVFVLLRSVRGQLSRANIALIVVSSLAPVASELILGPLMQEARGLGEMRRFALLHGASGALFLAACLGSLTLVWRLSREA